MPIGNNIRENTGTSAGEVPPEPLASPPEPEREPDKPLRLTLIATVTGTTGKTVPRSPSKTTLSVTQGDILKNVSIAEDFLIGAQTECLHVSIVAFPHIIVLSQACDLEGDCRNRTQVRREGKEEHDKYLLSVLVAPLYDADYVFAGTHLTNLGLKMRKMLSKEKKQVKEGKFSRYYYVEFPQNTGLKPAIIDFKHYCSANIEYLQSIRSSKCVLTVPPVWREAISQKFAAFLSRIGLPADDKNDPIPMPRDLTLFRQMGLLPIAD